jgi:hypothetical protein
VTEAGCEPSRRWIMHVLLLFTCVQTIFSMSGDAAKLDRFERRFAWFKVRCAFMCAAACSRLMNLLLTLAQGYSYLSASACCKALVRCSCTAMAH